MSDRFIEKITVIGQGSYGRVFKCREIKSGEIVAMKEVNLDDENEGDCFDELRTEISTLLACSHQNIIKYRSSYVPKLMTSTTKTLQSPLSNRLCIVMDYCELGSLRQILESHGPLPENIVSEVAESILKALEYLHIQGIGHRDLKAANVLVDSSGTVKLGDFGVAMLPSDTAIGTAATKLAGSPYWMAPEILSLISLGSDHRKSYDSIKADIWSFGITLIELLKGKPPLHYLTPSSAMKIIPKTTPPRLESSDSVASTTLKDLIHSCLHDDPNKRPTASLLLKYFKNYFKSHKHSLSATTYTSSTSNSTSPTLLLKFLSRRRKDQIVTSASFLQTNNYADSSAKTFKDGTVFSQWDFNLNTTKSFQDNNTVDDESGKSENLLRAEMHEKMNIEDNYNIKLTQKASLDYSLKQDKELQSERKARKILLKSLKTQHVKDSIVSPFHSFQLNNFEHFIGEKDRIIMQSNPNILNKERNGWEQKDPMQIPIPPPMYNLPDLSKPQYLTAEDLGKIEIKRQRFKPA